MKKQTTVLTEEEMKEFYSGKPLSVALREKANAVIEECGCPCHRRDISHFTDCCQFSYKSLFRVPEVK